MWGEWDGGEVFLEVSPKQGNKVKEEVFHVGGTVGHIQSWKREHSPFRESHIVQYGWVIK